MKKFLSISLIVMLFSIGFYPVSMYAGTATLNWNANTESDLAGYKVYYDTASKAGAAPCSNAGYSNNVNVGNTTSHVFNNLADGVTYYFAISAIDTSGNESSCSVQQSKVIPPVGDTTPPSVPSNLLAKIASLTQINLSWTASIDNVGVTGYRIYRCQGAGCTAMTEIGTSVANSYSDKGLTTSVYYNYAVSAYDAAGNGSVASLPAGAKLAKSTGGSRKPPSPKNLTIN